MTNRSITGSRTTLQREYNKLRVAELKVSGWTANEIVDIINREMERDLEEGQWRPVTRDMIRNDWIAMHKEWKETQAQELSSYFFQELLSLEVQNEEAWRQYRRVTAALEQVPHEEIVQSEYSEEEGVADQESLAGVRRGNKRTSKQSRTQLVNEQKFWWEKIESIAANRRKILDLDKDGPSLLIDNRRQTVVNGRGDKPQVVKTYAIVSPDNWGEQEESSDVAEGIYE